MEDCLERKDALLLHKFFMKKTKIFTMLCSFFNFQNHFLKYKVSTPFSLVEEKTQVFNIDIG